MSIDEAEPHLIDGLALMRAFMEITEPADRRKVIELAVTFARNRTARPSRANEILH